MKKYLKIYRRIFLINLARVSAYRVDAILGALISTAWGGLAIVNVALLTSQTKGVMGWTADEIILLSAVYSVVIGLFHTILSHNFAGMSQTIHYGELDGLLLKPIDSQFFLSTRYISIPTFFRQISGVGFVIWFMGAKGLETSLTSVVAFIAISIPAIILIYSIQFIFATLLIWFSNVQNIIDLLGMITGTSKYPKEILRNVWAELAVFLLPILLVVNVPTRTLLGKVDPNDVLLVCILSVILLIFSHYFWKFALKYYGSASG